jgi:iron complex outermembrane receptor protein
LVNNVDPLLEGKKAPSVPTYEVRMTGEVDLPFVPGATITAAVFHSGPAAYDDMNTFNVPAWTRVDLGARYVYMIDKTKMTARFNVENLTDEAYWIAGYGSGSVAQSGARRYVASVTASF